MKNLHTNLYPDRNLILERDPRLVLKRVRRREILVSFHGPFLAVHSFAELRRRSINMCIIGLAHSYIARERKKARNCERADVISHLFTIDRNRLFLCGPRSRSVIGLVLQGKLIRIGRYRHQDLSSRRAQSTYQVYQIIRVQHVEESHQTRRVKSDIDSVFVCQVVRWQRK